MSSQPNAYSPGLGSSMPQEKIPTETSVTTASRMSARSCSHTSGDPLPGLLSSTGVPYVARGAPPGHESEIPYVAAGERGGARAMVDHPRSTGRRRIATVTGPLDTFGGRGRMEGYRDVVGSAFDESLAEEGDYTQDSGERAMTKLLERHPDLDAVFVANDAMALGALNALNAAGRRVPEDVAIGGFDDSTAALAARPALTTMRQPGSGPAARWSGCCSPRSPATSRRR